MSVLPSRTSAPAAIPFAADMEQPDKNEARTNAGLIETITKIQTTVYEDSGTAMRGVHSKAHGVLSGTIRVLADLPPVLAQGLFATPGTYPVIMRLSTIPGDVLDDAVSVPRGLALKIVGVSGARVSGSQSDVTQDFVFANGSAFSKAKPDGFLSVLKLLASTTDKSPGLKKALSTVMRGAEKVVEAVGRESATLMTLGGYPQVHILGDEFYSQVPVLYGNYMAKVAVKPFSAGLRALSKAPVDLEDKPNGLREAVVNFFRSNSGEWDLQVQLCTDLESMPIEDASRDWPQEASPYITVARISMPPQNAWSAARVPAGGSGDVVQPVAFVGRASPSGRHHARAQVGV